MLKQIHDKMPAVKSLLGYEYYLWGGGMFSCLQQPISWRYFELPGNDKTVVAGLVWPFNNYISYRPSIRYRICSLNNTIYHQWDVKLTLYIQVWADSSNFSPKVYLRCIRFIVTSLSGTCAMCTDLVQYLWVI